MGHNIFIQSEDRTTDGYVCLSDRAKALFTEPNNIEKCKRGEPVKSGWMSGLLVRCLRYRREIPHFGIRGPVTTHEAYSVDPVTIDSFGITKSVNALPPKNDSHMSSDRMGAKHFVKFGLYIVKGAINVQLAEKTGFTEEDAEVVKKAIATMFVNDASAARPEGSMEVIKLYWFKHNCKDGQYSSAQVHRSVKVRLKDSCTIPRSVHDYDISVDELYGLDYEDVKGVC